MSKLIKFVLILLPLNLLAATPTFWPEGQLSTDIPSLVDTLGHDHGEAISTPAELSQYLRALAAAAPDRTRLVQYATSWEGRPLVYLVIASEENIARLDKIKSMMQRIANPAGLEPATAASLIDDLPAIVWLSYGVHGNEISSGDAALVLARHLLASNAAAFESIASNTVVVIDPAQNPDGRARFVQHYQQHAGLVPSPSPIAAERREAWPGGRSNHYLFDMNRDWFALSQPETRGRVANLLEFYPLVHVDVHEMGTNSSYYFPPPAKPFNPHLTESQRNGLEMLGEGIAAQFDRFRFDYFTREVYDALYPGYGDSWPAFQGALGMTFEMASARGLAGERDDGSIVTYRDGVLRHFVATVGTLLTASANRERLLRDFLAFRQAGMRDDQIYGFALDTNDPAMVYRLGEKLRLQGIVVEQATDTVRMCGKSLAAGSLVVRAGQPAAQLVRTLLDKESTPAAAYIAEQERRRKKGLSVELYDVLGWSLPAAYSLDMTTCAGTIRGSLTAFEAAPDVDAPIEAGLAYLVPWGSRASALFLTAALRSGLVIHTSTRSFVQQGKTFPAGTLIVKNSDNGNDVHQQVVDIIATTHALVVATDSSWTDDGSNFGSQHVRRVSPPRIALAWDEPTRSLSTGATRYFLEQELGYPVTPVRTTDLGSRYLEAFDVLILPDGGNYKARLNSASLVAWVKQGGTLIGFSRALRFLAEEELLATKREKRAGDTEKPAKEDKEDLVAGTVLADADEYAGAIAPDDARPDEIPGVLMRGISDEDHWLTSGISRPLNFMIEGVDVYSPLKLDEGVNAVRFAAADDLVAGGYLWEENLRQWAYKPAVMVQGHGEGHVIGFVGDPTFRAFMNGLDVLLVSAVFRATAYQGY